MQIGRAAVAVEQRPGLRPGHAVVAALRPERISRAGAHDAEKPAVRQLDEADLLRGVAEFLMADAQHLLVAGKPAQPDLFLLAA